MFHLNHRTRRQTAFTLLELLVVISILGILAALSVPAIKNLGKSNLQVGAAQQMLDDVGQARQLAISHHTTVYMVFVTTNFFNLNNTNTPNTPNINIQNMVTGLENSGNFPSLVEQTNALNTLTNLVAHQLSGYNFVSYGNVGDQPGQHQWHYLSEWKFLPDGAFIAAPKFQLQQYSLSIPFWQNNYGSQIDSNWTAPGGYQVYQISGFNQRAIPFPTDHSPAIYLPYIAFDYRGRLISEVDNGGGYHHAYIPLAQGSVGYGHDINKQPALTTVLDKDIVENPPGNSTNTAYNVIDISPLTGRAELEEYKMP